MRGSQRAKIPVGLPPNTRLLHLERLPHEGWVLWLHTNDYIHGTHLVLYDDGRIERVTVRRGEGDDITQVKPPDENT